VKKIDLLACAFLAALPFSCTCFAQQAMPESAHTQILSIPSVAQYGARADGQGDNLAAFQRAIHELAVDKNRGGRLFIPPGRYHFSASLHISRGMVLEGASGAGRNSGTILMFDPGVDGIVVDRFSTSQDGGAGDWTVIRDLAVQATAPGGSANGITLHARARIENVYVRGFGGNGIEIAATARGNGPNTNANNWSMDNVFVEQNGGHGVHAIGADANAGVAVAVSAMGNGGWGFLDESFLGNTYVGCHTENNKKGGYSVTNRNARSILIGSYTEGGQPDNQIQSPSMVIGGLFGNPQGNGYFAVDGRLSPNWTVRNPKDPNITTVLGFAGEVPRGILSLSATDGSLPYRLEYQKSGTGWWDLNYGEAANGTILSFSTNKAEGGAAQVRFPNGFSIGQGASSRKFTAGVQPPSTGVHEVGEVIFSTHPERNGFVGWVAVKGGSPGDWVPFGELRRSREVQVGHGERGVPSLHEVSLTRQSGAGSVVFDAARGSLKRITLHEDVLSSALLHLTDGEQIGFLVCQDASGGHRFRWPQNVRGGMAISPKPETCSAQSFVSDGKTAFATTPGAVSIYDSTERH